MHFNSSLTADERLYNAIRNGDEDEVGDIITQTPTIMYKQGKKGWTHLHTAVEKNNPKLVNLFLITIENINAKIDHQLHGLNKLKKEFFSGSETEINVPISSIEKLKINIRQLIISNEQKGISVMDLALHCRCYEIVTLFRKHVPCEVGFLKKAIKSNDKKLFDCLIQDDNDLTLEDIKQRSIAHFVIKKLYLDSDKIEFLDSLIDKIDLNKRDYHGATPLHYAYALSKYQVENYCDQNETEEKQLTMIEYLESKGADPEIIDNLGYSVHDWKKAGGKPDSNIGTEKKLSKKSSSLKKILKMIKKISVSE